MYSVVEVNNENEVNKFLSIVNKIYASDPLYIRPMDKDIIKVFNPAANKFFSNGKAIRWNLYDGDTHIGRVAAFYSESYAFGGGYRVGGMGFFECIENKEAAYQLFDLCIEWLANHNIQIMEGPVNFGERNAFWGLLISTDRQPNYMMNHNPNYYIDFFESYGFQLYFKQYSYYLNYHEAKTGKYYEKSAEVRKNPDFSFAYLDTKKLEKFAEDFRTIYNRAWANKHTGFKEMSKEHCYKLLKSFMPIIVNYMLIFVYYKNEPIGMFFAIPELNEYFKGFNGKLHWFNKLRFLKRKLLKQNNKFFGVVFGVVPEFQGKGVEGSLVSYGNELLKGKGWEEFEMGWLGDFSPKMLHLADSIGAKVSKVHHTYRIMIDKSIPFQRLKALD